ncbi:MAG: biopolymer transporter ExbD [Kofleriaceae bacterium]|nr:biopolymer transporter ExbD [Kofleriaceae bacterium]
MTPLIDVVLVLLIIFMVTMPITMTGIGLQVPPELAEPQQGPSNPLVVTVAADLTVTVEQSGDRQTLTLAGLSRQVRNRLDQPQGGNADNPAVFVDFADEIAWQFVVETMDQIRGAARDVHHDEITIALVVKTVP